MRKSTIIRLVLLIDDDVPWHLSRVEQLEVPPAVVLRARSDGGVVGFHMN